MRKTLEQERASFCIERVRNITSDEKKYKYKSNAKDLPSFIVSNGLIPALAFYKSKEDRKPVYNTINEWLKKRGIIQNDALDELTTKKNFKDLRLATVEALAIANWLKRIVEVEIGD